MIEVRVATEIDKNVLDRVVRKLKPKYTRVEPVREVGVKIDDTGANVTVQEDATGYRLASEDQADIVLLTRRSFATARLPPYPGWPSFRDLAKTNWASWNNLAPPQSISRIGVRFINRIDVPTTAEGKIRIDEYFNFQPKADVFGATLSFYLVQARFPTYLPKWTATVTTTPFQPNPVPGAMSIMLDIDVYREVDIPIHPDRLWLLIEEGRSIKNDLFERALTDKSRDLFR